MRGLMITILTLCIAGCVVAGACAAADWPVHGREMLGAAAVALIATMMGLMPAMLNRQSPVETLAQAALAGTMLHMMLSLILAGGLWFVKIVTDPQPFVGWLLVFYFASLGAMAAVLIGYIRQAPRTPSHS